MNSKAIVPQLDRVDLADAQRRYGTTPWSCECPDHRFRERVCKHMAAAQDADALRLGTVQASPSPAQSTPSQQACNCAGILFANGDHDDSCASQSSRE